jgi:integrase
VTYQAHVYDKQSKRRLRRTFPTKSAAKRWRADAQSALRRGAMTADRGPTLAEASECWLDALRAGQVRNRSGDEFKPSAVRGYAQNLTRRVLPGLGHLRLSEVTTPQVQQWVDGLVAKGLAPATVDAALTPLRSIYRWALQRGYAVSNPTRGIHKPAVRPSQKAIASPAEAVAMIEAVPRHDRALWAVALLAGLRRGELIGLRWDDVDLAAGVLRVERGWDMEVGEVGPKSRVGRRSVPISAVLHDYLAEHRMECDGSGRVFGDRPRWVAAANDRARAPWTEAGLPAMTLHGARHTFASLMIAAGVNAKALSVFMGHSNIAITMDLYGHLMPGSEAEAAGLLDAYLAREAGGSTVAQIVAQEPETLLASG